MSEETKKAKGHVKQAVGETVGNDKLKRDGKADVAKGKVEGVIDDIKEAKDAVVDELKRVKEVVTHAKESAAKSDDDKAKGATK